MLTEDERINEAESEDRPAGSRSFDPNRHRRGIRRAEEVNLSRPEQDEYDEDRLFAEIDDFRKKARVLQEMMNQRESRARQLAQEVNKKQEKANRLEREISRKQDEAREVSEEMDRQSDEMLACVEEKLDTLEHRVSKQIYQIEQGLEDSFRRLSDAYTPDEEVGAALKDLETKITQTREQLDAMDKLIRETTTQMNEKIHTESVKSFRNVQESLKNTGTRIDDLQKKLEDSMEAEAEALARSRRFHVGLVVFTILNTLGIVGILLYESGILNLIG